MHKVFVYGTLRPGMTGEKVKIPGELYDLGWYPGARLSAESSSFIICEEIKVDDAGLARLDRYEGYYPDSPEMSLYLRTPYKDGYIYTYNGSFSNKELIESGDWLEHKNQSAGSNSQLAEVD